METDRIFITGEQAIEIMNDGESVHTFRSGGIALIGCDWNRDDLIGAINSSECEIGGEMCQAVNHGLVVWTDGPLFVECKPGTDYAKFGKVPS